MKAMMMVLWFVSCAQTPQARVDADAQRRLTLVPDDAAAALSLGLRYEQRGDLPRAQLYLRHALDAGASPEVVLTALVRVSVSSGDYLSALKYAQQYESLLVQACPVHAQCEELADVRKVIGILATSPAYP